MCQPTPLKTMPKTDSCGGLSSTSLSSFDDSPSSTTSKDNMYNQHTSDTTTTSTSTVTTLSSLISFFKSFTLATLLSIGFLEFALWFPYVIPGVSSAAIQTYIPAFYTYDKTHTSFDNTNWTYGTDYILTVVMFLLAAKCYYAKSPSNYPKGRKKNKDSFKLRVYSASLLLCYGISTLAGGYSHQKFIDIDMLNTTKFRIFWIVCVGNVSFASCYMGLIGREVQRVFGVKGTIPLGPW